MTLHTGERWEIEAGDPYREFCPMCQEWMEVTLDSECVGCGEYLDDLPADDGPDRIWEDGPSEDGRAA